MGARGCLVAARLAKVAVNLPEKRSVSKARRGSPRKRKDESKLQVGSSRIACLNAAGNGLKSILSVTSVLSVVARNYEPQGTSPGLNLAHAQTGGYGPAANEYD